MKARRNPPQGPTSPSIVFILILILGRLADPGQLRGADPTPFTTRRTVDAEGLDSLIGVQDIENLGGGLPGPMDVGDYDGDGDLDIVWSGYGWRYPLNSTSGLKTMLYRQEGRDGNGNLRYDAVDPGIPGVTDGCVVFGDFDADGDLDLCVTGNSTPEAATPTPLTRVYRNDGATWTSVNQAVFTDVYSSAAAWGDMDQDGDLDLAVTGMRSTGGPALRLYGFFGAAGFQEARINGGTHDPTISLHQAAILWDDFDNDGDPDLIAAGRTNDDLSRFGYPQGLVSVVLRNNGRMNSSAYGFAFDKWFDLLPKVHGDGLSRPTLRSGDLDGDGLSELLLQGARFEELLSVEGTFLGWRHANQVYVAHNRGANSTSWQYDWIEVLPASSIDDIVSQADWSDLDGDGDLDIVLSFVNFANFPRVGIINSHFGTLSDTIEIVPPTEPMWPGSTGHGFGLIRAGDLTGDNRADLLVVGRANIEGGLVGPFQRVYENNQGDGQLPPSPSNVQYSLDQSTLNVTWTSAGPRITSNVILQRATPGQPGGIAGMALVGTGRRQVIAAGNAGKRETWSGPIHELSAGSYTLGVQTIGANWVGSPFVTPAAPGADFFVPYAIASYDLGGAFAQRTAPESVDLEGDGDLDVFLPGNEGAGDLLYSRLLRNHSPGSPGNFELVPEETAVLGVSQGSQDWVDLDADGDLDLLLTGFVNNALGFTTSLWRNDGGSFVQLTTGLPGTWAAAGRWGDYNRDGRPDIYLQGGNIRPSLYRNDGPAAGDAWTYTLVSGTPEGPPDNLELGGPGAARWADYERDGDLDIIYVANSGAHILRNLSPGFDQIPVSNARVSGANDIDAFDYDADGDLDVVVSCETSPTLNAVYRNEGGHQFTRLFPHASVGHGNVSLGDLSHDGQLDFLVFGNTSLAGLTNYPRAYFQSNGSFAEDPLARAVLGGPSTGNVQSEGYGCLGDLDGDGDLDILMHRDQKPPPTYFWYSKAVTLFESGFSDATPNLPPATPDNLRMLQDGDLVWLSWDPPADDHSPAPTLSYDVRLGTAPGGRDLVAPSARSDGRRMNARRGRAETPFYAVKGLPANTTVYWSVQAIDGSFRGSAFASEQAFAALAVQIYSDWIATFGAIPAGQRDYLNDFDTDGLREIEEFFHGTDPTNDGDAVAPYIVEHGDGSFACRFPKRKDARGRARSSGMDGSAAGGRVAPA